MTVDPLSLSVIAGSLGSIAEEMGWVMMRTAYSEAVREGADGSATVLDPEGNLIGEGNYPPAHLYAAPVAVAAVKERYPVQEMRPGDAFLLNDPAMNSGHLPDMFSIAPVFDGEQLIGFTVVSAHHVDVGGATPGSQAVVGVSTMHQEGMRVLPVRHFAEGVPNEELLRTIGANVRVPDHVVGDLKSQYNANMVGAEKLRRLVARYGREQYLECVRVLLEQSEQAMRRAIAAVPDGEYEFANHLDDCGPGTAPIRAQLRVVVDGETLLADWSGSSPAARAGLNSYLPYTRAYTFFGIKAVLGADLPHNGGTMRPIGLSVPTGSVLNPLYPSPSGGRAVMVRLIVDCVFGAMAKAVPGGAQAASSQLCNSTIGGVDQATGRSFVYYDLTFGSTGARSTKDGCDGLTAGFNVANVPIEMHESVWPVRVRSFGFVPDSGGPGRFRGGMAVRREVESLAEEATLTNLHDFHHFAPWGLYGGREGASGSITLERPDGSELELHSKEIREIGRGEVVSLQACGGGGFGDPLERDPAAVRRDVREGWVTREAAERDYGVLLTDGRDPRVLEEETAARRRALREGRGDAEVVAVGAEREQGSVEGTESR